MIDGARSPQRLRRAALVGGVATGAVSLAAAFWAPGAFFPAYLTGYLFVLGLGLGCLGLLLLDHLVGGAWSAAIRRALEAGAGTMPWLAVLFVPLLAGLPWLYAWAGPAAATDPVLLHQAPYFNRGFFLARALIAFAVWITLGQRLTAWGAELEAHPTPERRYRLMNLSAVGLVVYTVTASFALIDWGMATEPRWISTIYPLMVLTGAWLSALSLGLVVTVRSQFSAAIPARTWQDLGTMLLVLLMSWAYLAFSQYLIIWAADLPSENSWYIHRSAGGWGLLALVLFVAHFLLPFVVLLSRRAKRHPRALTAVAAVLLACHAAETLWLVWPSFPGPGLAFGWLGAIAPLAPIGLWLWAYLGRLAARPATLPPHASFGEVRADG